MTLRTAVEIKVGMVSKMGPELGPIYYALWQEITAINHVWAEYVVLFGTRETRVSLLNEAAPSFFRTVQDALLESVILHLARLTDPAGRGDRATLTVQQLPLLIDDQALAARVKSLVETTLQKASFCRDLRNRRLAHTDLALATDKAARPLDFASRDQLNIAIKSMGDLMNEVRQHFEESETAFDFHDEPRGAIALIYVLDRGVSAEKEFRRRLEDRTVTPAELVHRDL